MLFSSQSLAEIAFRWLALFVLASSPLRGQEGEAASAQVGPLLDARHAEHLYNRLGFGARPEEIEAAIGLHATELFDQWVETSSPPPLPELTFFSWEDYGYNQDGLEIPGAPIHKLGPEGLARRQRELRLTDKGQFRDYLDSWFAQLVAGRDPLRDRMTLFWHGFFPTSSKVTLRCYELIHQHDFLRHNALCGFDDLLRGIVKDPAMLGYFDNDTNSKTHPNENFARELLELYSLGVGNYTEVDVRQAARALTGFQGESGSFVFDEELHDFGEKTILGRTGTFDGSDLVEILLDQEACARHVAKRLLTWLEGREPGESRLRGYAKLLRELDYELTPWLRRLVADPDFYRQEVIGTRVLGPVEFMVGASRRLGVQGQEPFLFYAATAAGQQIYAPPSVKGWDEGRSWITSSSMVIRGNCIGLLLGLLHEHLRGNAKQMEAEPSAESQRVRELVLELRAVGFKAPELIAGVCDALGEDATDEELTGWLLEAWLAREPSASTRTGLLEELAWCRDHFQIKGPLLASPQGNRVLCQLAYTLLRLPIAQLG
jgi:hypothetical protein